MSATTRAALGRRTLLSLAVAAAVLGTAGTAPAEAARVPDVVQARSADRLYPEGVAWDPTRSAFLVGSARTGTVSVVGRDGVPRPLVRVPDDVVSTFGLAVDAPRHRILVTFGDIGVGARTTPATLKKTSGLLVADLATGRVLQRVDLGTRPGVHAANDVAVDPCGTDYVTDTIAGAVYRVDTSGHVGVTADARFRSDSFGVNGIVWHPDGFVLTSRYDTGATFRIDRYGQVSPVEHAANLAGADGSALLPDGSLLVVTNRLGG